MGTNQFEKAVIALKDKQGHTMSPDMLVLFVKRVLASNDKTAASYCNLMLSQGLIRQENDGKFYVLMDWEKETK